MATASSRATRSKKATIKKKPSTTSLFSNLTKASKTSSSSNSTVTQESVSRPKQRSSRQGATQKAASTRSSTRKSSSKSVPNIPTIHERAGVFQYLEEDDGDAEAESNGAVELEGADIPHRTRSETGSLASSSSREQLYPMGYHNYQNDYSQNWANHRLTTGSLHSDSGISVRSSSPERDSLATTNVTGPRVSAPFDESPEMSPEAFYSMASRPIFQQTEYESDNGRLPSYRDTDLADTAEQKDLNVPEESHKSGYDLLASNISSTGGLALTPIYRKFETLNNRVLLHLQDEIIGLENYLAQLDKAVVGLGMDPGVKASSPLEDSPTPEDVRCQRAAMLNRISAKLDQYNRALSSYSSLSRHLDKVCLTTVDIYKEWLEHHPLTNDIETSFLYHDADLVAVTKHYSTITAMERSAVVTGSALLLTVIAFKIIPQFASRLLVGIIIALAMSCSGSSVTFEYNCLQELGKRVALYGAVIIMLALAVG